MAGYLVLRESRYAFVLETLYEDGLLCIGSDHAMFCAIFLLVMHLLCLYLSLSVCMCVVLFIVLGVFIGVWMWDAYALAISNTSTKSQSRTQCVLCRACCVDWCVCLSTINDCRLGGFSANRNTGLFA